MPKFAIGFYVFVTFAMGVMILTSSYTPGLELAIAAIP